MAHVLLICLLGLLAYSNTFDAPFLFDDGESIVENPIIKDLGYFTGTLSAKDFDYDDPFKSRYVGYLTFALNYSAHGLDVRGYHIVNLLIHILNALLVYASVVFTFRTPFMKTNRPWGDGATVRVDETDNEKWICSPQAMALFSALLFVSHPVQTQAVTYIVQRVTSLTAFFYLASLVFYIKSRLSLRRPPGLALYAVSLASAVLATKTKEMAFTLPLVISLYEFMFFRDPIRKRVLLLVPFLLTMIIIPWSLLSLESFSYVTHDVTSRPDNPFMQFRVIVTYLRLILLPVGQNFDYDYPEFHTLLDLEIFLSFMFLCSIIGLGVLLFRRSSRPGSHAPELRLVSFGIFWFFMALSVESVASVAFPIQSIFEHRVYLPSVGAFTATAVAVAILLVRIRNLRVRAVAVSILALIPLVFTCATYARNALWGNEIYMLEDVVSKSPKMARAYNALGSAYAAEGLQDAAIKQYRTAIRLAPDFAEAYYNLGVVYSSKGIHDAAIEQYRMAISLNPSHARGYVNIGVFYLSMGMHDDAVEQFKTAIRLDPSVAEAYYNLGIVYASRGMKDAAIKQYRTAIRVNPSYAEAYVNLGAIYMSMGMQDVAMEHFMTAKRLDPSIAEAYYNIGGVYGSRGLFDEAIEYLHKAIKLNPSKANFHAALGRAYEIKGLMELARQHYSIADSLSRGGEPSGNLP